MAITTKKPFVYTQEYRYHGEPASSAPGSSTAPVLVNNGIHRLVVASTYFLQGPAVGSVVTIYATSVDASVKSVTSTGGQVSFDDNGGTQVLNLMYDSTTKNCPMITLLGESATQWRIMSMVNPDAVWTSSSDGISVTT
jgi:hypothetical protein